MYIYIYIYIYIYTHLYKQIQKALLPEGDEWSGRGVAAVQAAAAPSQPSRVHPISLLRLSLLRLLASNFPGNSLWV